MMCRCTKTMEDQYITSQKTRAILVRLTIRPYFHLSNTSQSSPRQLPGERYARGSLTFRTVSDIMACLDCKTQQALGLYGEFDTIGSVSVLSRYTSIFSKLLSTSCLREFRNRVIIETGLFLESLCVCGFVCMCVLLLISRLITEQYQYGY